MDSTYRQRLQFGSKIVGRIGFDCRKDGIINFHHKLLRNNRRNSLENFVNIQRCGALWGFHDAIRLIQTIRIANEIVEAVVNVCFRLLHHQLQFLHDDGSSCCQRAVQCNAETQFCQTRFHFWLWLHVRRHWLVMPEELHLKRDMVKISSNYFKRNSLTCASLSPAVTISVLALCKVVPSMSKSPAVACMNQLGLQLLFINTTEMFCTCTDINWANFTTNGGTFFSRKSMTSRSGGSFDVGATTRSAL